MAQARSAQVLLTQGAPVPVVMAKAMRAAMKARKAMKAMKVVSARLAKRHAFFGKIDKTKTGLKKTDLVKNKAGRIVSRKKSALGKKNTWIVACNKARAALKIKGFTVIKKG